MVLSEPELVEAVARDRAAGRTIAFANGCFDLLHVGHVRYLQGAAAEADRLIVAVNDDRSVAALKGAGPPDPAGRGPCRARRRRARRRLRRRLRRSDRRAAAAAAQAGRPLQGHRLHRRHRARARRRAVATAAARPSSATRRAHATRDLLARLARRPEPRDGDAWTASSSFGSARWATSCTRFRWRRRCAARFPPRASTGSSARSTGRSSTSCRSSIGVSSSTIAQTLRGRHAGSSASHARELRRQPGYDVAARSSRTDQVGSRSRAAPARRGSSDSRRDTCASRWRALFYTDVHDPGGGGIYDRERNAPRRPDQPRVCSQPLGMTGRHAGVSHRARWTRRRARRCASGPAGVMRC